jgi:hypothetical protein
MAMVNLISRFRSPWHLAVGTSLITLAGLTTWAGWDLGRTRVVRVHGRVFRYGQPVPHLFLNFIPEKGRPSWALTDDNGYFVLHYDNSRDGAEPGRHSIWVNYKPLGGAPGNPPRELSPARMSVEEANVLQAILAKYGNPKAPLIVREIAADDQEILLELD